MKITKLIGNSSLIILLASNALILTAAAMLAPIYAFLVDDVGGNIEDAGITYAAFAFTAGLTTLITGRYIDQIKNQVNVLISGYLLMALGYAMLTQVSGIYSLIGVQLLIGIGEAVYAPAFDSLFTKHLDAGKFGSEWGEYEATYYFSVAIGGIIGALVAGEFGFEPLFILMSLLCFLAALTLYMLPKKFFNKV